MIRNELLEHFILAFGLEIPDEGRGRPIALTSLWLAAKEKCGDCDLDEVLDALYNLNPNHAELNKFVPLGEKYQAVSFERMRNTPKWKDFFYGDPFRIKVLPQGRVRYQVLAESARNARTSEKQPDSLLDLDRNFARLAIEEARKSVPEDERPHPKVGAIVVKDGKVLSAAHRGETLQSHAEYIALEKKLHDDAVAGATVYTTLEPCTARNHPKIPCAQRLIDRKVARVVIGMLDPNPEIRGMGEQLLSEANIETQFFPQDLKAQVAEMNRDFIRAQKQKQARAQTTRVKNLDADAAMTAARLLSDATRDLQKAAWSYYALHTQFGVARAARDLADEEKGILEEIGSAFRVFGQDYDLPEDLATTARNEIGNINIALVNLKASAMTGQVTNMEVAATQIQDACERIRIAAKPYAYRRSAANP